MVKVIAALMILFFVAPAVFATDYTVGDAAGWALNVNYDDWASRKTFFVGDTLIFTYTLNHDVGELTKSNYDTCGTSSVIEKHSDGNTTITLSKTGPVYFVCLTGNHCIRGMKLTVTVAAASTTPTTPPTPTTPTPPTTPTTPSPPKSDTPSAAPPKTPGTTTPTTPTPSKPSAATSSYNMNFMVIGASVMLASVFAFMV